VKKKIEGIHIAVPSNGLQPQVGNPKTGDCSADVR